MDFGTLVVTWFLQVRVLNKSTSGEIDKDFRSNQPATLLEHLYDTGIRKFLTVFCDP